MNSARDSLFRLFDYCKSQDWIGYDPYDGLNSEVFHFLPAFKNIKIFRLLFSQMNKKSVFNFRPLIGIRKGRNPKGTGLFLSGMLHLYKRGNRKEYLSYINSFLEWLKKDICPGYSGYCWGYNFDWQSRAFFLPKGTPTVVNTSFIGRAFLEGYEVLREEELLEIARSACNFILKDLKRLETNGSICFSYSPRDRYFVHNATALASSLLAMTFDKTREEDLVKVAKKSIQYVIDHQTNDGAWVYGEDPIAQKTGTDNFHTGFILESLKIYTESTNDDEYKGNIKNGLDFYQNCFFLDDGTPKYFPHKIFPIDIHSASQAAITLIQLRDYGADMNLCRKVISWMIDNLQDSKGYFYYQKGRFFTNKIPYMRWAQAWAFRALSSYLYHYE